MCMEDHQERTLRASQSSPKGPSLSAHLSNGLCRIAVFCMTSLRSFAFGDDSPTSVSPHITLSIQEVRRAAQQCMNWTCSPHSVHHSKCFACVFVIPFESHRYPFSLFLIVRQKTDPKSKLFYLVPSSLLGAGVVSRVGCVHLALCFCVGRVLLVPRKRAV